VVWLLDYVDIATIYPVFLEDLFFFHLVDRKIVLYRLLSALGWLRPAPATGSAQAVRAPGGSWACTDKL